MVSHDAVAFYLLSEEVAKSYKVVQSGQGADEVFAGYSWYPPLYGAEGTGRRRLPGGVLRPGRRRDGGDAEPTATGCHEDPSRAFLERHFAAAGRRGPGGPRRCASTPR